MPRVRLALCLRLALVTTILSLAAAVTAVPARAAETADEADIEFQLGTDRYDAGDFKAALGHFLASNRLAANKNVLFNIGRCYEQLKLLPEAYRYYALSLEEETDPERRPRIEESLARLQPEVARLTIESDPPGAVIYIDRKDLGSRGTTPRTLAMPAGEHTVLLEHPDFEPQSSAKLTLRAGEETRAKLRLTPIFGTVHVRGTRGASIRADTQSGPPLCGIPCAVKIPPGRHVLFLSKPGLRPLELPVEIVAKHAQRVRAKLEPLSGSLVVNSDVRGALVTIDGEPRAFTPAVIELPVGDHEVAISQSGFRPITRRVRVEADTSTQLDFELSGQEEVLGASRAAEPVENAPASVTILSREELRAMAYPTISEAIRGVRGIYLSYDDTYHSTGVRGFSPSGSHGNRILVLVDGRPVNDNRTWSSYVGFDARVDLDDVERIEVIRGAGSVVYGTGAFVGVINLVTRSKDAPTHAELAVSTALGAGRARATAVFHPVRDAGAWVSIAGAKAAGLERYYPEFVATPTDDGPSLTDYRGNPTTGMVRDADGFRAGTLSGHAWYRALSARWMLTSHEKHSPSAQYGTLFGDPRTTNTDLRGFVDLQFEPVFEHFESLTRVHFDTYHYSNTLPYAPNATDPTSFGIENDEYTGLWGGVEQRVIMKLPPALKLTLGADFTRHFKTHQRNIDDRARPGYTGEDRGPIIDDDTPFHNIAGYALLDAALGSSVRLSAGARVDYFDEMDFDFGAALSPRLALILKLYDGGNLKIMAGKAFRVPSAYERLYVSTAQIAPSNIQPEQMLSAETEFTHRFSTAVSGVVTAYVNHVSDLIELGTITRDDELLNQYRNSDAPVLVLGSEAELRRDWRQGYMLASSVSVQRARYLNDDNLRNVPNSPLVLASAKAAMPILGRALALATRVSIEGPRSDSVSRKRDVACDPDAAEPVPCPKQGDTDTGVVWDVVFTGALERFHANYALGFYNAMDWQYDTVPSTEYPQRTIRQRPRSLIASVELEF